MIPKAMLFFLVLLALISLSSPQEQAVTGTCILGIMMFLSLSWIFRKG